MFERIRRVPRMALIGLVRTYQLVIAPHLGSACRYEPSCSAYAINALRKYGALKGMVLAAHRISRCHPWGGHGYDPPVWYGEKARESDALDPDERINPEYDESRKP